jgi:hypothetical protein
MFDGPLQIPPGAKLYRFVRLYTYITYAVHGRNYREGFYDLTVPRVSGDRLICPASRSCDNARRYFHRSFVAIILMARRDEIKNLHTRKAGHNEITYDKI